MVNIVFLIMMNVRYLVKKECWEFKQPNKRLRGRFLAKRKAISSLQGPLKLRNNGKSRTVTFAIRYYLQ